MQVMIPLAGKDRFFDPEEYGFPKPLIEVRGRPMIHWVVDNLKQIDSQVRFIFVTSDEQVRQYGIERIFDLVTEGNFSYKSISNQTEGALCTCLMAIDELALDEPLIISNGDQIIEGELQAAVGRFKSEQVAAGVITFPSVHPRWSYVGLDESGEVIETAEKRVISRHARAAIYN